MSAIVLDFKSEYNRELLKKVAKQVRKGSLVIFPTETVYGIGTNGFRKKSVDKIFEAKGRKSDNPLIMHVGSFKMIKQIATNINKIEQDIILNFFPGPITVILNKRKKVPSNVSANLQTVGVRMPANTIAHDFINLVGKPIAAPSANISGRPSGTNIEDIFDELKDKVDYIIDAGETRVGVESTVVRVIDEKIVILRPGYITKEDLENLGYEVVFDKNVFGEVKEETKVLSPGLKYRHYAPKTKCVLVYGDNPEKVLKKIKTLYKKNTLVITNNKNTKSFENSISYGDSLEEISHNIFKILRKVDTMNADLVIIEGVKYEGLGIAIMNRLVRACSHNTILVK